MKKVFLLATVAIFCMAPVVSCSGDKAEKGDGAAEVEQVVETRSTELDMERLKDLVNKESSEITSADFDFLIEQGEIFADKTEKMSKDEYNQYIKTLSTDEVGAVMVIAMGLEAAKNQGKLSDEQLKRYNSLKERDAKNKK